MFRVKTEEKSSYNEACDACRDELNVNTAGKKSYLSQNQSGKKKTHFCIPIVVLFFQTKSRTRLGNVGYERWSTQEMANGTCCEQVNARG